MKNSIIKLDKVWKTYKMGEFEVHALRGLDLDVREGEFLAIQGPSGSGKSTAMNLIGCLDIPSRGTIYLDGHDISKLKESDLAQIRGRKIGFIFQQFNLINTLSEGEGRSLARKSRSWRQALSQAKRAFRRAAAEGRDCKGVVCRS
jgi:putative ABC transport system ATP-binding protein